jgi:succinate dehydrogenase / fumarate reductase cytochrome b subunit
MMEKIIGSVRDVFLNINLGMLSFAAQRVSGILIALYLLVHICILSSAVIGGKAFDWLIKSMASPVTHALEIVLITGVMFHLFNGLRIMIADFLGATKAHVQMLIISGILTAAVFGLAVLAFLPRITH